MIEYHHVPSFETSFITIQMSLRKCNRTCAAGYVPLRGDIKIFYGMLLTADCYIRIIMNHKLRRHLSKIHKCQQSYKMMLDSKNKLKEYKEFYDEL